MTEPHAPTSSTRPRGNWVVLTLIALGLIASLIAVLYWRGVGERTRNAANQNTTSSTSRSDKAAQEVAELQQGYTETRNPARLEQLIARARDIAGRYPDYAPAHTLLGQLLLDSGDPAGSLKSLEASLAIDQREAEVHILAGHAALMSEDLGAAERHFSQAVGINPRNGSYRLRLADVALRTNDFDGASRLLLEALRLDSSLHAAHSGLADLYAKQNKLDMALQQIQKAIDRVMAMEEPDRHDYIIYTRKKAALLRRDNRPTDAKAALESLTASERINPDVLEEVSLCWSMMGQPDMAANLYEQALIVFPLDPKTLAGAARWRFQAGDREAAMRHLRELKKVDPNLAVVKELEKLMSESQ